MPHLDLNLLTTFKTIAECNSLSLAAQRLHRTQAAISIQLKKLEEQIGKKLVERGHQRARLTADGEVLLQYARKLLALSNEALDNLSTGQALDGTVRFGIPDDHASAFLLPVVQRFARLYPNVKLKITNDLGINILRALEDNELDLALVSKNNSYKGEVLRRDPLVWVASNHFKMADSRTLPLAVYPQGCQHRKTILDKLSDAQYDYDIAFECSGFMGMQIAIDSGLAITATTAPFIHPNWRTIQSHESNLPSLGASVIQLHMGTPEPTREIHYFAEIVRQQVTGALVFPLV